MNYLLDTNHAIAWLNGDTRITSRLSSAVKSGDRFSVSSTVLGELYFGAYASQHILANAQSVLTFATQFDVYDFDALAAEEFGRIKAEQRSRGKPIPTADAQIAAVARAHRLTLLTNDAHFQLVANLTIANWLA